MTTFPAVGWVRANQVANEEVLSDINKLRKDKERLEGELLALESLKQPIPNLADMNETFTVNASYKDLKGVAVMGTSQPSWAHLFGMLAPLLASMPNEKAVRMALEQKLFPQGRDTKIFDRDFETIGIQFQALGFVEIERLFTAGQTWAMFWKLTPLGARRGLEFRAIRTAQDPPQSGPAG